MGGSSPDEAATTAVPTATAVATALTVAPVVKIVFSSATTEPASAPWRRRFHRLVFGSSSRPSASVRRARKISVSTAACVSSISCEISRYESPCHSRSRIARRWLSGMRASASSSPIRSSSRRSGDGVTSWIAWRSLGVSTRPRRNDGAVAGEADVLGDLEQPGRLGLRHDTAAQAAERVQERVLDRVLGLLARAELVQAVAVDLARVALVEIACEVGFGRREGAIRRLTHGLWTVLLPRPHSRWRTRRRVPPERVGRSVREDQAVRNPTCGGCDEQGISGASA